MMVVYDGFGQNICHTKTLPAVATRSAGFQTVLVLWAQNFLFQRQ
jgi:hypothetical protein